MVVKCLIPRVLNKKKAAGEARRPRKRARDDSGCGETNLGVDAIVAGIPLGDSIGMHHAPYRFLRARRARRARFCRHLAVSPLNVSVRWT